MGKSKVVTEFTVEVTAREIRWGGFDIFLLWLLRRKTKEGFWPYGRAISRIRRDNRRLPSRK